MSEVNLFLNKLRHNPVGLSFSGLFVLNKETVLTVSGILHSFACFRFPILVHNLHVHRKSSFCMLQLIGTISAYVMIITQFAQTDKSVCGRFGSVENTGNITVSHNQTGLD